MSDSNNFTPKSKKEVTNDFIQKKLDLSKQIQLGNVTETDLFIDVVKKRNDYIESITKALWGNRHGHDFDLENELYKVRAIIDGDIL